MNIPNPGELRSAGNELTITIEPANRPTTFTWLSVVGGSYRDRFKWDPFCDFPRHDGAHSDTAVFPFLDASPIPIDASGATAGRWEVTGVYETSGNAHVFAPGLDPPSLSVAGSGHLRHVGGILTSVNTVVGNGGGTAESKLEIVNAGTEWLNPGTVQVGLLNPGRVEIEDASVQSGDILLGGSSANGEGALDLQGAAVWTASGIQVGGPGGRGLTIGSGARLTTTDLSTVDGVANQAGLVIIAGESAGGLLSTWSHQDVLEVASSGLANVRVEDGGFLIVEELKIGQAAGSSGGVRVKGLSQSGEKALLEASRAVLVGQGEGDGLLEILEGARVQCERVEVGCNGKGTVAVSGTTNPGNLSDTDSFAALVATADLVVGCSTGGGQGTLTVGNGGVAQAAIVGITGSGADGRGQIIVDGQGGRAKLNALSSLVLDAMEIVELEAKDGGEIKAQSVLVGVNSVRPGSADLTLRGRDASGGPTKLEVVDLPGDAEGVKVSHVGFSAPGQLSILSGARAELKGGLTVGQGAQGIVVMSNTTGSETNNLVIDGETQIGVGGAGILQAEFFSDVTSNGAFKIGLGAGLPSGSVTLDHSSRLDVNGTLSVGVAGQGLLTISPNGFDCQVECDTLVVGGSAAAATGIITLRHDAKLLVAGNAQVGLDAGRGEIHLADSATRVSIDGTLTIGDPNGGSAGGAVTLSDARIEGTGSVVVNPNGCLLGTGIVALPRVTNSACISPGLSPGTLTVDGDYEQTEDGVLIIEVAGLEPGQFDVLRVTGDALLAGTVDLRFIDGFVPQPGDSVDFVVVDGTITGKLTGGTFIDVPADTSDDSDEDPPALPVARAEVVWEVTPEGTCRLTVTDVTLLDDSGRLLPTDCGAGLCGAGVAPLGPLGLLGLMGMKLRRRD